MPRPKTLKTQRVAAIASKRFRKKVSRVAIAELMKEAGLVVGG